MSVVLCSVVDRSGVRMRPGTHHEGWGTQATRARGREKHGTLLERGRRTNYHSYIRILRTTFARRGIMIVSRQFASYLVKLACAGAICILSGCRASLPGSETPKPGTYPQATPLRYRLSTRTYLCTFWRVIASRGHGLWSWSSCCLRHDRRPAMSGWSPRISVGRTPSCSWLRDQVDG